MPKSIDVNEAEILRKAWGRDKPCDHPDITRESALEVYTGNYVCVQCGRYGYGTNWWKGKDKESN